MTDLPSEPTDHDRRQFTAARRLGEGTAAAVAAALPLLPAAGFLTRYLGFALNGVQGADVVALALPLSELIFTGMLACWVTAFFLVIFLFVKPGSWGSPARIFLPGPGPPLLSARGLLTILALLSPVIVVLLSDFPLGIIGTYTGTVLGLWGSYITERIRKGANTLLLVPIVVFTLSSGIVGGGLGGNLLGVHRANVVKVDVAGGPAQSVEMAILGRDNGGYWLQQCVTGRSIRYIPREYVKSVEILGSPSRPSVTLFGAIFQGDHLPSIGYHRPC